jgi:SAM-dependent methyltransferase
MNVTEERHFTGSEITDEAEYYNHLMHIATYQFALKYVRGKSVLDWGCGTGYGSHMLAGTADKVTAADISDEAIEYAKKNFSADNLVFKNISELPDQKFDIITAFQVIEHVRNGKKLISDIGTFLNHDGCLLISTPDSTNRLFRYIQRPWNVFHYKEYSGISLDNLLRQFFSRVEIQKIGSASEIARKEILRAKKQRLVTLPCTLIFFPDFLRIFLLKLQKRLYKIIRRLRRRQRSDAPEEFRTKFFVKDIVIDPNTPFSTDLLAICFI